MKNTKLVLFVLLILAGVAMVARFWDILMLFLVSAIIAYILSPLASRLQRKTHMKRGFAVAIVLLCFVVLIVTLVSLSLPRAVTQISSLVSEFQRYASNFDSLLATGVGYLNDLGVPPNIIETLVGLLKDSDQYIASFLTGILAAAVNFSLRLFDGVIVVILVVYFMLDGRKLIDAFVATLPRSMRAKVTGVMEESNRVTWRYIKSKVVISAGMAVCTYIGLSIIGVHYALLFAMLSFVLDFIPYFGSIIAGVIEGFFALVTMGVGKAIVVVAFVVIVQQVEGNIVIPKVQGDLAGIHPITVMFAILASNEIWGPVGMLISVPIAAIVKIIVREVYLYAVSPDDDDPRQLMLDEMNV